MVLNLASKLSHCPNNQYKPWIITLLPHMSYNLWACNILEYLMVNFMCQIDWAKGYPDSWWNICLWECFQNRLTCESVDELKKIRPHQCEWQSSNLLGAWIEENEERKANSISNCAEIEWEHCAGVSIYLLSLDRAASGSWDFGLRLNFILLFCFSILQMADCTSQSS